MRPRPELGVSYAAEGPTAEFATATRYEAIRSLAASWNVSESRAAGLLADPAAYRAELSKRDGVSWQAAMSALRRKYPAP